MRETPPPEVMELLMRRFAGNPEKYGSPDLTNEELRTIAPWLDVEDEPDGFGRYDRRGRRISLWEFAARMENHRDRVIRQTHLPSGVMVSTVFLSLDHGWGHNHRPVLFETMVFFDSRDGGSLDDVCRYHTEEEARASHERFVKKWRFKKAPRPSARGY